MKYITRLGAADWLDLYRKMISDGVVGDNVLIDTNEDLGYIDVTFREEWTDDDGSDLLDTRYRFRDYDAPECLDCQCSRDILTEMKGGFFGYMMATFGQEYLSDFITEKSNVKINFPPYFHLSYAGYGEDE